MEYWNCVALHGGVLELCGSPSWSTGIVWLSIMEYWNCVALHGGVLELCGSPSWSTRIVWLSIVEYWNCVALHGGGLEWRLIRLDWGIPFWARPRGLEGPRALQDSCGGRRQVSFCSLECHNHMF